MIRNRVVSLHDVVEFTDLDLTGYEGATVKVEGGQFVLVAAPTSGSLVDGGYATTTNPDLIDGGNATATNPDLFDGGASA